MNPNHRLDAPDENELKNIEQVNDRSDLTTLYRQAKNPWDGELVSQDERERRRIAKEETLSFGIRKQFLTVGLLSPLPFVMAFLVIVLILLITTEMNVPMLVVPGIFVFLIWAGLSFYIFRKIFALFYANALQAGPFLVVLFAMLAPSAYILYIVSAPLHSYTPMTASIITSSFTLLWSAILSYFLLLIWTTPKLNGNVKFGLVCITALLLLGGAVLLLFFA